MATCAECGSPISEDAAFCSTCGAPVHSRRDSEMMQRSLASGANVLSVNVAAMFAYLLGLISGIIFLSLEPYKREPFVRFHAFQSICYSVVVIAFWIIWNNLAYMGYSWMGVFWVFIRMMGALISMAFFFYWLFLMYKAYNKEKYLIPVVGEFASNLARKQG
jgi:uncharacterized membrane protein